MNINEEGKYYASMVRKFRTEYKSKNLHGFCKDQKVSYTKMLHCLRNDSCNHLFLHIAHKKIRITFAADLKLGSKWKIRQRRQKSITLPSSVSTRCMVVVVLSNNWIKSSTFVGMNDEMKLRLAYAEIARLKEEMATANRGQVDLVAHDQALRQILNVSVRKTASSISKPPIQREVGWNKNITFASVF